MNGEHTQPPADGCTEPRCMACRFARPRPQVAGLPWLAALVGSLLLADSAQGQPSLDWYTVDGGGATSTGGSYTLRGTIGQPDFGWLTGGDYALAGGFWPGVTVVVSGPGPTLFIQAGSDQVRVFWSPATPGYTLELTDDLSSPTWLVAPSSNPVTFPLTGQTRFYRLRK